MKSSIKHRCLIVDDEPIARKIIKTYIGQLPHLECVAECKNAYEALEQIYNDPTIDIVFLDINMPNISGIAMVKILPRKLQVIFTTAYSEFAIESYELEAADYLPTSSGNCGSSTDVEGACAVAAGHEGDAARIERTAAHVIGAYGGGVAGGVTANVPVHGSGIDESDAAARLIDGAFNAIVAYCS